MTHLETLRGIIHQKIDAQMPASERDIAKSIANVVIGVAQDAARIADALEGMLALQKTIHEIRLRYTEDEQQSERSAPQ